MEQLLNYYSKENKMKKIIVLLTTLVALASAGVFTGAELSQSYVKGTATATSSTASASEDFTDRLTMGTLKAGYQFDKARLSAYYTLERYKESGKSKSYGVEADYMYDIGNSSNILAGGFIGKGTMDADGLNLKFKDVGVKCGIITDVNEAINLEAGVKINRRVFDDITFNGALVGGDETQIGFYIGIGFML